MRSNLLGCGIGEREAQLRAKGVDIGVISKQLGHSNITTTARYLDHIAPMVVVDVMRGRSWKGA